MMSEPIERLPIRNQPLSLLLLHVPSLEILTAWSTVLKQLGPSHELLLVGQPGIAEPTEPVRLLAGPEQPTDGDAIRVALAAAQQPLFGYVDCRCCVPDDVPRLLEHIDTVDLVSGFRVRRPVPLGLRLGHLLIRGVVLVLFGMPLDPPPGWDGWREVGFRWLCRFLFGLRLWRSDSPCRLARREIFRRIPIQSDSAFVHVEIIAKANFLGCLIDEVQMPSIATPSLPPTVANSARQFRQDFWRLLTQANFGTARLQPEQSVK